MVHWIIIPDQKFPPSLNVDATKYSVSEYDGTTLNNLDLILIKLRYANSIKDYVQLTKFYPFVRLLLESYLIISHLTL